ncbi:putative G-protein coupled receptor F59B2.13 [Ruditapes philippinarum]|uniref:putative G-protein coupled receptor F59B2.13 n=1 Tax=Ruditapes philippinarum TaxID=129788 RepID=UPI00295B89B8|nr:putative G-protein coupled receptor F59B2.13 [Ruditapes philippinarum]
MKVTYMFNSMDLKDYHDYRMAESIEMIYPPILIIFGLTGNIASLIILAQVKHRKTSTGVMLIFLTFTDSLILVFVVFVKWLQSVFEVDIRSFSSVTCKVHVYLTYFLLQLSPWILVILTAERICSVLYIHKVRRIFTRRNVLILSLLCVVCLACLNSHILYGFTLDYDLSFNKTSCQVAKNEIYYFMFKIWPWIDFLFAFAIPFCVLLCGNIIVLRKIKESEHFRKSCTLQQSFYRPRRRKSSTITNRVSYFTKVAIFLSGTFIVCVSPFTIFAIGQPYWFPEETMTSRRHARLEFIGTVMHLLMYTNNAINFVLYILCSSKFWVDFNCLCCKGTNLLKKVESLAKNG